ncbi:MAG: FG-GAP repeat domain-containing protein, partial [Anaerolineae bacterium]
PTPLPGEALVPSGPVTPPPPDFNPTPPPYDPMGTEDEVAWTRKYIELATAVLNSSPSVEEALDRLRAWSQPGAPEADRLETAVWASDYDVDDDGEVEWLMSLPLPGRGCGITFCPTYLVLFEMENSLFRPVHLIREGVEGILDVSNPQVRFVEDVNGDGVTEVVIQTEQCGAHTCFTSLIVGRWDGGAWQDLAAQPITQAYTDLTIADLDDDGALEFVMEGGTFGSVGAGLQRQRRLVFDWLDGAYRLVEEVPEDSDIAYYRILDANAALAEGDLDAVLSLAGDVMAAPNFTEIPAPVEPVDKARIVSYAGVEVMLVHALRDEPEAMAEVLAEVRAHELVTDTIYLEAAQTLLDVYRETGDAVEACAQMEEVVAADPERGVFFQWYGYGTERMTLDQICPLDPPREGASPDM